MVCNSCYKGCKNVKKMVIILNIMSFSVEACELCNLKKINNNPIKSEMEVKFFQAVIYWGLIIFH